MTPVVFDLDGTLIDSAPDIHRASGVALAAEGLAPLPFAQVKSFIGDGVPVLVSRLLAAHGLAPDPGREARLVKAFLAEYEQPQTLTRLYPGAAEALASLASAGHPLGICTNKPFGPTQAALAQFGIADFFAAVIGGDSLPQRKPDPAPLRRAAALLGGGPALFVGDSEVDAACAEAAGMPFLLFTEGYRKSPPEALPHTARFSDHAELPALASRFAA